MTDITDIRTEGFLYLAVVLDLFSRQVVGWATRPTQHTDPVLQALLAAVWRRKPEPGLLLHSDQGSQFRLGATRPVRRRVRAGGQRRMGCVATPL